MGKLDTKIATKKRFIELLNDNMTEDDYKALLSEEEKGISVELAAAGFEASDFPATKAELEEAQIDNIYRAFCVHEMKDAGVDESVFEAGVEFCISSTELKVTGKQIVAHVVGGKSKGQKKKKDVVEKKEKPEVESMELVKWDQVKSAIAEASSVDEVKKIRDKAEAFRYMAKQAELGLEVQNMAAEARIRAERRCGEFLKENLTKHRPKEGSTDLTLLKDVGISKNESSEWQLIAALKEKDFESHIVGVKESQDELTTAGILRFAKKLLKPPTPKSVVEAPQEKVLEADRGKTMEAEAETEDSGQIEEAEWEEMGPVAGETETEGEASEEGIVKYQYHVKVVYEWDFESKLDVDAVKESLVKTFKQVYTDPEIEVSVVEG